MRLELGANFAHILLQDAGAAGITEWTQPLLDDCGGDARIFFQPVGDVALERVELAGTLARGWTLRRRIQILLDGFPTHVKMALDFADGPVFGPVKPVQVVDLLGRQHCSSCLSGRNGFRTRRMLFARRRRGLRSGASASITHTWPRAELLFARCSAPAPTSQTSAAECFRSRAEVLFARLRRRCLAVTELLLFPISSHRVGVFGAVSPPVIRDCAPATSGGYRGRPRGIRGRRRSFPGDSRSGADADRQPRYRPSAAVGTSKFERTSDNSGNAVPS